jgi:hypothetical protein
VLKSGGERANEIAAVTYAQVLKIIGARDW